MSIYDQHTPSGGDFPPFFTFHNPGMSLRLAVSNVRRQPFKDDKTGETRMTIILDGTDVATGREVGVSCGAWRLEALVMEHRPEAGDVIDIAFIGKEGNSKLWTLTVVSRGGAAPQPAPAPAPAPQQVAYDPAVTPAPAPAPQAYAAPAPVQQPAVAPPPAQPAAYQPPAGAYQPPVAAQPAPAPVAPAPAVPAPGQPGSPV